MKKINKVMALMMALTLLIGAAIGGTIAWLTATSNEVVNTFTTSDVGVGLDEDTQKDAGYQFKMIPGHYVDKDPKAWVTANSEDCYLFVKVTESENFDTFMTYGIETGWQELIKGEKESVYYKIFDANSGNVKGTEYPILAGNKVNIQPSVTKEMMGALIADDPSTTTVNESNYPTLTFKAYAIQLNEANGTAFTPEAAWNLVKDAIPANP